MKTTLSSAVGLCAELNKPEFDEGVLPEILMGFQEICDTTYCKRQSTKLFIPLVSERFLGVCGRHEELLTGSGLNFCRGVRSWGGKLYRMSGLVERSSL